MKKLIVGFYFVLAGIIAFGQGLGNSALTPSFQTKVLDSSPETTIIEFSFDSFSISKVSTNLGEMDAITLPGTAPLLKAGYPEVLLGTASVIIPDEGVMGLEILASDYKEYHNINLIPSRGNLYRNENLQEKPFQKGGVYSENQFYPGELASMQEPYIFRDFRGQTVVVYPFQYNPVTGILRVYKSLTVKVSKQGPGGSNVFPRTVQRKGIVEEFSSIYSRHFVNYEFLGTNYIQLAEEGNMLVVSHGSYMPAMEEFVLWKNQKGIPCQLVDVATVGSTAAVIKSWITNYYNTYGLTYLLLVGDAAHIPTNSLSSGHSDNAYAFIAGNDHYPEFFVGRFSAETIQHVQTQVLRTLSYEISPDTSDGWHSKAIGIASEEGPGHNNLYDHDHIRILLGKLMNYTYTDNLEFYEGSQGGNDAPGDPTAAMVSNGVNLGGSTILYTGHGSTSSWGTSGFSNTSVSNLTNFNKWPFIWSVACVNGNFVGNTCFAEAWLRATQSGRPTGAVAFFGSTINQSWDPPMAAQIEMVDILTESTPNNIKRTFGGLSINGCMKMNDLYGYSGDEMTDTWVIFGDPSLQVATKNPSPITASHQQVMFIGTSQFTINCPVEGAKATLSLNGQILGTGIVSASNVNISFNPPTQPDTLTLVITAFNRTPYIASIPLIVGNAPFVIYNSHLVKEQNTNNSKTAEFGETVNLDVELKNVGNQPAGQVTAVLRSMNHHVVVIDSTAIFGSIPSNSMQNPSKYFTISISDSVPNKYMALMELIVIDSSATKWTSYFSIECLAPTLVFDTIYIDDTWGGNGNGKLEPGEVVVIMATVRNSGGAEAKSYQCSIASTSAAVQLFGKTAINIPLLPLNTPRDVQFFAKMDTVVAVGTNFSFDASFASGYYQTTSTINGNVNFGVEDWETGNFTKFSWSHAGAKSWNVVKTQPYEGSYCAKSGAISHNSESILKIDWQSAYADTISFWVKVSCENGGGQKYDRLEFTIDGVLKGWWDGTKPWMRVSYPVKAGNHEFKWTYIKDPYVSSGSDAAWLDLITFPAAGQAIAPKPFVIMEEVQFSDAKGNNNGFINGGDEIELSFKLTNIGFTESHNTTGLLSSTDPLVTIIDGQENYGNIPAGASFQANDAMRVKIAANAPSGSVIELTHTVGDNNQNAWSYPVYLIIDAPVGVEKTLQKESLTVFPNPCTDRIYVIIPRHINKGVIQFFAIDGKLLLSEEIDHNSSGLRKDISASQFPPGLILVKIISEEGVYSGKVIKQ